MSKSLRLFVCIAVLGFIGCSSSDITIPEPSEPDKGDPKTSLLEAPVLPLQFERPIAV